MVVPGHPLRCVGGHRNAVFPAALPTKGRGFQAGSRARCCERGSRLSAGLGAVAAGLEEEMERSLVHGFVCGVQEAGGESHDYRPTPAST